MSQFPKTRAAAGYAASRGHSDLTRSRAAVLLRRLRACEPDLDAQPPIIAATLLRNVVLAVRDLAGPAWLEAGGDDSDIAAFSAMQATASPPDPATVDEICSRVLWARFPSPAAVASTPLAHRP